MSPSLVEPEEIRSAEPLIRPYVRRTPVIEVDARDFDPSSSAGRPPPWTLKLELLQHAGSFKTRGAFTNLLTRSIPAAGVVAASGGNHGAAVAYAAHRLGVRAKIFVPTISSAAKVARIRDFGAKLVIGGDRYADALAACIEEQQLSGALSVHAFDQKETMVGQGTLALELEEQAPKLDTVLVGVGGGGLIGGIASWYQNRVKVIGVEPEAAPTLTRAREAGRVVDAEAGGIAADSLAPKRVGELVFPITQQFVERVVLVEDAAIARAQKILWSTLRLAVEPGGAAAFSALLSGRYVPSEGERVGVVISGGNTNAVDFDR